MEEAEPLPEPDEEAHAEYDDVGIYRCPGCYENYHDEDGVEWCANTEDCPGWENE
jgi:hypothetical protein